jgi:pSer/pThr/pTyr-binding forkhead associated (FHA) protein
MEIWVGSVLGVALVAIALASLRIALRRGRAGRLVFLNGPREGESFALSSGRVKIGALADNDIVIPSPEVSRYHAELRVTGERVQIWDLQALNHTYVNDEQITTHELSPQDVIRIADVELRYSR